MSTELTHRSVTAVLVPINDDLEAIDRALVEVAIRRAGNIQEGQALDRRFEELASGAKDLRRKQARSYLDMFIPPIKFFSIHYDYEMPANGDGGHGR
jgi:hypothetical protein